VRKETGQISVRDEYIERYLVRYRQHLQLSPLPSPQEKAPLITTLKISFRTNVGRFGLRQSGRYQHGAVAGGKSNSL